MLLVDGHTVLSLWVISVDKLLIWRWTHGVVLIDSEVSILLGGKRISWVIEVRVVEGWVMARRGEGEGRFR